MDRIKMGRKCVWVLFISAFMALEGAASDLNFEKMCSNMEGTFSMSDSKSIAATMIEGEGLTAFVNEAPEFVFECKSNHKHTPTNTSWPEIKFESSSRLNQQINSYGEFIHPGTMRRNLSTILMQNDRQTPINKKNQTVSCMIDNKVICKINIIVIVGKVSEKCSVPTTQNNTERNISINVENAAKTVVAVSQLDCKLHTDLFGQKRSGSKTIPPRKFSVLEKGKWIECLNLDENSTTLDVRFNTPRDIQKIRCPFKINANPREAKAYMIRVETNYKSEIAAAIPMLAPPEEIQYSFFSVYLSDTVLQQEPIPAKKEDTIYPIWVPILTSLITVSVVVLIVIVVIKFKCFKHTMGTFCFKEDIGYKIEEEMDGYPTKSLNKDKYIVQNEYGNDYMKSNYSGYSDTTSMMTTSTDPSVSYLDASGRPHNRNRLISEITDLDERTLDLKDEDKALLRKTVLARQLSGDPSKLNPNITLNEQAKIMVYNPKLEIDRANFSSGQMLGSGNFGCVYEGEAIGLFHPDSKTKVAVKTVNDPFDGAQRTALLCEMKILSNLELHLNLVNMMGSCTSDFANSGELWLLLEFCQYGDMKTFLIKNEAALLDSIKGPKDAADINSRLLIQWAYNIAKGMRYLSRKHIMHGDLAARNILIGRGQGRNGLSNLVAKVSDFGLSKTFYDNIRYKKQKRQYVPWKWMAIEYLQTGCLTITSDVWSYGIVLWELFSLGKEPYIGKNVEEMILKLKDGYHLPCPEEVNQVKTWSPVDTYNKVADGCFVAEPMKRATFSDIVQMLEAELTQEEKDEYRELTEQYSSMRELMEDPVTQLKRSSTFTRQSLQRLNNLSVGETDEKLIPLQSKKDEQKTAPSYMKAVAISEPQLPGQVLTNCDISADGKTGNIKDTIGDTIEYIAFQDNSDLKNHRVLTENDDPGGYITFEGTAADPKNSEDQHFLSSNTIQSKGNSDNECNPETENLCAGYVTIEHCIETA